MKDHELIIEDAESQLQRAMAAEQAGDYISAYHLYRNLWQSDFWSEGSRDLLRYANASESVGDYQRALMIYTSLMESSTLELEGAIAALIQTSMERLHKKLKNIEHPVPTEVFEHAEVSLVKKLFRIGSEKLLEPDSLICESGDLAQHMWLLVAGEVEVQESNICTNTLTGTDTDPCLMGEVAYFTGLRRVASLRCVTQVRLFEISYSDLDLLELKDERIREQLDLVFKNRLGLHMLSQHDLFKRLNDKERELIASSFIHIDIGPDKILIEQKLPRDACFMVQSGTLMMLQENIFGELELVASMHPGDIINLTGLLKDFRSPYRIITGTACRVLMLSSESFEPILENNPWFIKEVLQLGKQVAGQYVLHPHTAELWAGNRNINLAGSGK